MQCSCGVVWRKLWRDEAHEFEVEQFRNQFYFSIGEDRYRVEKFLAKGGFGRVFAARPVHHRAAGGVCAYLKFTGKGPA